MQQLFCWRPTARGLDKHQEEERLCVGGADSICVMTYPQQASCNLSSTAMTAFSPLILVEVSKANLIDPIWCDSVVFSIGGL